MRSQPVIQREEDEATREAGTAFAAQDPSIVPAAETLALRRPDTPVTLSELAALRGDAQEVIEARIQIITTLRRASIRATHPEDWVLYKAPLEAGGQIVAYLQDAGCDRVRDLWGIEIFNVGRPEKVTGTDPGVFHYLITGSGRCKLTRQVLEQIEGGRSSTDEFVRGKSGVELDLLVRKSARANLDGNVTRELAGMKAVPLDELKAAWTGTNKCVESCRLGRGFGTRDERLGAPPDKAPDIAPPVCPHCGTTGVYRPAKGTRGAFYGCPNYATHADKKFIIDAAKWVTEHQRPTQPPASVATRTTTEREPGEEG